MRELNLRRALSAAALLGLTTALSGCFQPLYSGGALGRTATETAAVDVMPLGIAGKMTSEFFAHEYRNELEFLLTGGNETGPKKYKLVTSFSRSQPTPAIDSGAGRAHVDSSSLVLEWELRLAADANPAADAKPAADGKPIAKGRAITNVSFDRTPARFASVRAERDAMGRAAKSLAETVRSQLAAHFARAS